MAYLNDICEPLIKVLEHAAGLPRHHLAGHAANAEFWMDEVQHALHVIDDYRSRFERMREGARSAPGPTAGAAAKAGADTPRLPTRESTPDHVRKDLRKRVCSATERFLSRSFSEGLIDPEAVERWLHVLRADAMADC
jgi:hypothetical protein